ncbi:MAG: hypothetical protein H7839_16330 [Magnetococcus sp. YQC-5]
MERRLYFIIGDVVSCSALSVVGTWAAYLLPSTWPMMLEMMVGMVVGMIATMAVLPVFMMWFGAMEVMVPAMLGSMLSSMLPSMVPQWRGDPGVLSMLGAGIGVLAWLFTRVTDHFFHGEEIDG